MRTQIRKFGTLFLEDQPYLVDSKYPLCSGQGSISIQDTEPGMAIEWVEYDDLLVSKTPLLTMVAYQNLLDNHLAGDYEICLEGVRYEVRLPIAGRPEAPSLDDQWFRGGYPLFDLDKSSAQCLGIRRKFSVPSEEDEVLTSHFAYFDSPRWTPLCDSKYGMDIFWRPILEPVFLDPEKLPVGASVRVLYGSSATVYGNLIEVSKYDIVLDNIYGPLMEPMEEGAQLIGKKKLVVERASIQQLRRNRI